MDDLTPAELQLISVVFAGLAVAGPDVDVLPEHIRQHLDNKIGEAAVAYSEERYGYGFDRDSNEEIDQMLVGAFRSISEKTGNGFEIPWAI